MCHGKIKKKSCFTGSMSKGKNTQEVKTRKWNKHFFDEWNLNARKRNFSEGCFSDCTIRKHLFYLKNFHPLFFNLLWTIKSSYKVSSCLLGCWFFRSQRPVVKCFVWCVNMYLSTRPILHPSTHAAQKKIFEYFKCSDSRQVLTCRTFSCVIISNVEFFSKFMLILISLLGEITHW